jgi:hypothetical protein
MKLKISLVVQVDPKAWQEIYGIDSESVRDDVRAYVLNQISQSAAAEEGGITSVGAGHAI